MTQPQYTPAYSQGQIDQLFTEQVDPSGIEGWQLVINQMRQQTEQLQQLIHIQSLRQTKHGVVTASVQQVWGQLSRNPQMLAQVVQQAISQNPQAFVQVFQQAVQTNPQAFAQVIKPIVQEAVRQTTTR